MPFNLFHRKKQEEEQTTLAPSVLTEPESTPEIPTQEATANEAADPAPVEETSLQQPEQEPETAPQPEEQPEEQPTEPAATAEPQPPPPPVEEPKQEEQSPTPEQAAKIYLKAMPLKDLIDVESVKDAVTNGNIIILRITPLAGKSIEDVKKAVNDLFEFAESINGDIARLGEERVVICPKTVRIWREKTPAPVAKRDPLPPTTA